MRFSKMLVALLLIVALSSTAVADGFDWLSIVDLLDPIKAYGLKFYRSEELGSYTMKQYADDDFSKAVVVLRDEDAIFAVYAATKECKTDMFLQSIANTVINPDDRLTIMLLNTWLQEKLSDLIPGDSASGMLGECYFELEYQEDGICWLRLTEAEYYGTTWID